MSLDDYPTTWRHRQEYPVPGAWVLGAVDGDGAAWHLYPLLADEQMGDLDEIEINEALPGAKASAFLMNEMEEDGSGFDAELVSVYRLEISGTDVFRVREADYSDVLEATAEALEEVAGGTAVGGLEVRVSSGTEVRPPDEEEREEIERRRQENASLGDWA